jgi:hypothetical protein
MLQLIAVLVVVILIYGIWIFISSMSENEPPTCGKT